MRLFVAISVSESDAEYLGSITHGIAGARWVPDGQFHMTLRFLGELRTDEVDAVESALASVRGVAFEAQLAGLGVFPPRGEPKVLWAGVEAEEGLRELQRDVEDAVRRAGVEPERRRFHPHVTLARLRSPRQRDLDEYFGLHAGLRGGPWAVHGFRLYESRLTQQGAIHTVRHRYALER